MQAMMAQKAKEMAAMAERVAVLEQENASAIREAASLPGLRLSSRSSASGSSSRGGTGRARRKQSGQRLPRIPKQVSI